MGQRVLKGMGALRAPIPPKAWQMPKAVGALPPRAFCVSVPILDQGFLGACTAFGYAVAVMVNALLKRGIYLIPSTLAMYFFNRKESGFPASEDSGAYPEQSVISMMRYGVGSAAMWPYVPERFAEQPPADYMAQALDHLVEHYYRALTVDQVKAAISLGLAVPTSFDVPASFDEVGETGLWVDRGGAPVGGHMVCIVGYDDEKRGGALLMQNSWGTDWGTVNPSSGAANEGFFWVPYDVYENSSRWADGLVITSMDLD